MAKRTYVDEVEQVDDDDVVADDVEGGAAVLGGGTGRLFCHADTSLQHLTPRARRGTQVDDTRHAVEQRELLVDLQQFESRPAKSIR
jgi:hypothetical protein